MLQSKFIELWGPVCWNLLTSIVSLMSSGSLTVDCEVLSPIAYDGQKIDAGYRIDMLVEGKIIIENKAIEDLAPIHEAQLLTYLKLKDCRIGFLLNWNVPIMKKGIKRMVNKL
jgi:GxxExxY protein